MNTLLEHFMGVDTLSDQIIASDLLISAKAEVMNLSIAVTEAATSDARSVLRKQLIEAIATHEEIFTYMINKGWYHPYDANEQIHLDLNNGQAALNAAQTNSLAAIITNTDQ